MNNTRENAAQVHINIMELLVQEELDKQLKYYPQTLKSYLNKIEVSTYALNRLPPLYASSVMGKEQQKRIGKYKYQAQINLAVRRALAAIECDPLRKSMPLISETSAEYQVANLALIKLQKFLQEHYLLPTHQTLSWHNLTTVMQQVFRKIAPDDFSSNNLFSSSGYSRENNMNGQFFPLPKSSEESE
ncbi:late competence development ComFB family protein [Crocosphaera sp. XPORK-15E]|uniref:late competence development ComFB family protein n=1 Tax=Crocosphaera sp. XPORK-15E TaxID=3110247 RepID=UPI002B1EAFC5|nr:late competence development ComFB family protein [Crocosphaera sp. XPORK-15E]MEA5535371.1 late competence development ComFB family protein [Crocosphaera sp. XPORK-15E]